MNMCTYRLARSVYHGLTPQQRVGLTAEQLARFVEEKRQGVGYAGTRCIQ